MDTKRVLIGTLVGGVAMYVFGYLIFELAFGEFYARNVGSATGVIRDVPLQWATVLGSLSLAALVTLAIETRPGPLTIGKGFSTAAVVGFLLWLGVDLLRYGGTNVPNLTRALVDPVLEIVRNGAVGVVVAAVLARIGQRDPRTIGKPEQRAYMRT
jgi:hypothetical protein